ncbi:hypothetical protein [Sellimonas intestinalis]|uniref:hypothetical protein n=1 Tax=Sellimonas intestinalis TaxID=1653434 RepID=UPI003990586D
MGVPVQGSPILYIKKIIEEAAKHPERNYIVLVPEQFSMQTQKDLVEASPDHAIMNIDILSFGRLAYRVMEETGGEPEDRAG